MPAGAVSAPDDAVVSALDDGAASASDDRAAAGARGQLVALADAVRSGMPGLGRLRRLPVAEDARAAAVLILFGVLDRMPAARGAAASAVSRELDVLLLARATTLRMHAGEIAFPGGRAEPGDPDAAATALREAQEETGLDPAGVEVLGTLEEVPLAHSRHLVTPVLGWWRHPSPVRVVDVGESADVFRVPLADLLAPGNRGVTVLRRDAVRVRTPGFLVPRPDGERLVWGFTAMVLDALFDALGWTEPWDAARELPFAGASARRDRDDERGPAVTGPAIIAAPSG